jgi:hypothetical protein
MTEEHIPDRLEIYINEQRADLELFRLIVQICLVQFLDAIPQGGGQAYITDFENEIVNTLKTSSTQSSTEENRFRELMIMRAESFFSGIRKKKGYPPKNTMENPKRN